MKTFIAALALMSSGAVFAWGATGHRAVGEIASRFLDVKAGLRAHEILKGMSLAQASTWPDEIKSDPATYSNTFNWHYTTWQTDDHDHSEHDENASTGFLLKAINEQTAVLADPNASDEKKAFALKFVVHLVGDIHMPLHVGNGTDQGGNFCKVQFHGKVVNLHALWDEAMIDFTNLSFTELARFTYERRSLDEIRKAANGSIVDWALESKKIVPGMYPAEVSPTTEPVGTLRTYCKKDVKPEEMPKLAYDYSYKFMPVVEQRIFEAGVRLAKLLNENLK